MKIFKEIFDEVFSEERGMSFPLGNGFEISLGEFEGKDCIHLHLVNKQDWRKNTAVLLTAPYYFLHGHYKYRLNAKETKILVKWFNSKPDKNPMNDENGNPPANNWENLKNTWNVEYPQAKIEIKTMPDYKNLFNNYKDIK